MTFNRFFLSLVSAGVLALAANPAAAEDKQLTVYTYESFTSEWGPGPKLAELFEKSCACKVNYVSVADGVELLTRLKLEGPSSKADVVVGLDTNLVAEAKATGFFAPHGVDTSALTVPGGFKDDSFVPYDYGHFAVVYDTQAIKTPPKSLKELVEGDSKEKIVIEDPRTSTPGLGLLLWMKAVYGDQAGAAWAKLKDRILTVTPGWSEAYGLFTKGEVPMVLSYTTSPAYHMVAENSDRYQAADFAEGHYIQIEVAGLTKSSHDPDLAKSFLAMLAGPQAQAILPTTNWMMPVAKPAEPLPAAFDRLVTPSKTLLIPSEEVAANRRAWIEEWLAAMSRQ
ncbi:thiamine ABC transporter substrate binding subunit [Rhizobium rhizosphaerae]|uniref:Thiamine ABC transporter substrate binding subunit n=1 Tax=Xaviernesmea rhizosphaerae TaxID=1672749 RepID=A0A1Q9ALU1_9HYPH|nr:thiamine ABC transporter substrate binding subunit [Xaviernesmea rhizosphaerae]OLP56237.1 thiamine ABC transporter substrate binding subunit [Xaviernesmea rhizosphaerae]